MNTTNSPDRAAQPAFTYAELKEKVTEYLIKEGRGSSVPNYTTTINAFMLVHQRTDACSAGWDFAQDFEQRRGDFLESQKSAGLSPTTCSSRSSHLNTVKELYESKISPGELPLEFCSALSKLLSAKGHTSRTFHKTFLTNKCSPTTLINWCSGQAKPSAKNIPLVLEVERLLQVEEGTLINRLPKKLKGTGRYKRGQTSFGGKMINALKKRYGIWTPALKTEFTRLVDHKSMPILPEGVKRHKKGVWTYSVSSKGPHLAAANQVKGCLRLFFGYCCLPEDSNDPQLQGRGMKPEELTLYLLADKDLIRGYVEFQRIRAGGKYNKGSINFLGLVCSLLRPETGYLYQHPALSQSNDSASISSWHTLCVAVRERLLEILEMITTMKEEGDIDNFEKGRDPKEPIRHILALDRPLFVILRMIETMLYVMLADNAPPVQRAIHYRNILLIALLSANPLRARQFSIMEFDRHLVRQPDGSWWLQFQKGEFKNRKSLKAEYRVRVEEHIWPLIERYKTEFRPHLAGADLCKYVFRPCALGRHSKRNAAPIRSASLHTIVTELTQLYIPDSPGFGPHAFRHIVATDIIKARPEFGFFLAAKVLHDKLETVEKEYAHLKVCELFEPYNKHYGEAWHVIQAEGRKGAAA
jgi:integrase